MEDPDFILKGYRGALIAIQVLARRKYLAVVHREFGHRRVYHHRLFYSPSFQEIDPMAKRRTVAKTIDEISSAVPHLIRLPQGKAWIDYDEDADVLYVSLKCQGRSHPVAAEEYINKRPPGDGSGVFAFIDSASPPG